MDHLRGCLSHLCVYIILFNCYSGRSLCSWSCMHAGQSWSCFIWFVVAVLSLGIIAALPEIKYLPLSSLPATLECPCLLSPRISVTRITKEGNVPVKVLIIKPSFHITDLLYSIGVFPVKRRKRIYAAEKANHRKSEPSKSNHPSNSLIVFSSHFPGISASGTIPLTCISGPKILALRPSSCVAAFMFFRPSW
jgi:hypothetical protein